VCVCGFKTLPQVPSSASHLAVSVSLGTHMPTRSSTNSVPSSSCHATTNRYLEFDCRLHLSHERLACSRASLMHHSLSSKWPLALLDFGVPDEWAAGLHVAD
jgi:hypothetical protein